MKRRTLFAGAGVIAAAPLLDVPAAVAQAVVAGGGDDLLRRRDLLGLPADAVQRVVGEPDGAARPARL